MIMNVDIGMMVMIVRCYIMKGTFVRRHNNAREATNLNQSEDESKAKISKDGQMEAAILYFSLFSSILNHAPL